MKYYTIFGKQIGYYGWSRFDIPAFAHKYDYELAQKIFCLFGFTIVTRVKMLNKGEHNKR